MKRRSFIKHTTHALGIPTLLGAFGFSSFAQTIAKAAAESKKVMVMIYLQGGNDGLNTVIPMDQLSALNKVRPHVILPENKLLSLSGTNVALHPELGGLQSLFNEDRLRIIQSVGYPEQNYSHFRSTDIWMSGSGAEELVNSGWPGRYLDNKFSGYPENYPNEIDTDPLSIEIGYGSTMLFQGPAASMSMVLKDPTDFYGLVDNAESELPDTLVGDRLKHIRFTARQSQLYGEVVKQAAEKIKQQKSYPETDLAQQLKIVARLIAGGLKTSLYLVRIDGFDTHDSQVEDTDHTKGEHASLMAELNGAIMAFMNDLEFHGVDDDVVGMTFSEFGRRIVSNASLGTDHGAAAPMFVFGNNVVPGVLGDNPVIPENATYKDNLPWQHDFRAVYASLLQQWFGVSGSDRNDILFNDFTTLPIIKSEPIVSTKTNNFDRNFKVFPNPIHDVASVSFTSNGNPIQIDAVDLSGKMVSRIFSGKTQPGNQTLSWNANNLPAGNYMVVFRSTDFQKTIKVVKVK